MTTAPDLHRAVADALRAPVPTLTVTRPGRSASAFVDADRPRLRRIDVAAVMAEPPPPVRWMMEGFAEFGELLNFQGRGKTGKSFVALALGVAALHGRDFLGRHVNRVDWLVYLDGENPEKVIRRRMHLLGMPADLAERVHFYSARGLDLGTRDALAALDEILPTEGRGLVVFDSAIALHRADENSAGEVRRFVDGIRRVVETRDALALLLVHENRAGDLRGSLDWRNASDGTLRLERDEKTGIRTLSAVERRDGSDIGTVDFSFQNLPDRLGGLSGRIGMVADPGKQPGLSAVDEMAQRIIPLLAVNPGISQSEAARALGEPRDKWTFRQGWAIARAAGGLSPGGLGYPPIGDSPAAHPAQDGDEPTSERES